MNLTFASIINSKPGLKCIAILILTFEFSSSANTQSIYKDYLLSSNGSNVFGLYDSLSGFYKKNPLGKPYINRIEFRTQTDEFRLDRQEYTLRLRTSNPFNNSFQNKINQLEQSKIEFLKGAQFADKLYLKYKVISKFETLKSKIKYLDEEKLLNQKLVLLYKEAIFFQGKEDLEKYYESTLKLNKAESEIADAKFEYDQLQSEIFADKTHVDAMTKSLNIIVINKYINEYREQNTGFENELINSEISKSKLELDQKRSNDNKILDHIQLQYQSDPKDIIEKKLSLGVGIRIPQLIANRYQKEEYQLNLFKLKIEKEEYEDKKANRIGTLKTKINRLNNLNEFLISQTNAMNTLYNTDSLLTKGFYDAELLLQVKLQENRAKQQIDDLNSEAINLFIDFLYYTDHFYFQPKYYYLTIPFQEM